MSFTKVSLPLVMLFLTAACGALSSQQDETVARLTDSALATLGGALDDAEGRNFIFASRAMSLRAAASTSCDQITPTCQSGVATYDFNGCTSTRESASLQGKLRLSYSGAGCVSPLNDLTSLTLTSVDFRRVLNSGDYEELVTTSVNNYQGQAVGGGVRVERTGSVYSVDILGFTRRYISGSSTRFEHALANGDSTGLTASGSRMAGTRGVSGFFYAYHNGGEYTAKLTLANLRWGTASCCHPTSGTVTLSYGGKRSGTGEMEFSGCGAASLTNSDGSSESVQLASCR